MIMGNMCIEFGMSFGARALVPVVKLDDIVEFRNHRPLDGLARSIRLPLDRIHPALVGAIVARMVGSRAGRWRCSRIRGSSSRGSSWRISWRSSRCS